MTDTEIKNQKLSNEELKELATGLEHFGDMLIMMGTLATLEKELIGLDILMKKLFKPENLDLFQIIGANPELMGKVTDIMTKWKLIEEKSPLELTPEEKIEVGKSFKEFSSLLTEIVGGALREETRSE